MTDITERLRHDAAHPDYMAADGINWCSVTDVTLTEAADEIERLRAALEGMLGEWDKFTRYGSPMARNANEAVEFARTALRGQG